MSQYNTNNKNNTSYQPLSNTTNHAKRINQSSSTTNKPTAYDQSYYDSLNLISPNTIERGNGNKTAAVRQYVHVNKNNKSRRYTNQSNTTITPINTTIEESTMNKTIRSWYARLALTRIDSSNIKYILYMFVMLASLYAIYHVYDHYISELLYNSKYKDITIVTVILHDSLVTPLQYKNTLDNWITYIKPHDIQLFTDRTEICSLYGVYSAVQCTIINDKCINTEYSKPYVHCMLQQFDEHVDTSLIAFLQPDQHLTDQSLLAIEHIRTRYNDYVMIGSDQPLSDVQHMLSDSKTTRIQHLSLMIYNREFWSIQSMPSFIYGATQWDNWLLMKLILSEQYHTIDISSTLDNLPKQYVALSNNQYDQSRQQRSTQYNKQLILQYSDIPYGLGHTYNSDMKIVGLCESDDNKDELIPEIGCAVVVNSDQSHSVEYCRYVSESGWLNLVTVNTGYVSLALNWLCWNSHINYTNYIVLAGDKQMYKRLVARGHGVLKLPSSPDKSNVLLHDTIEYQQLKLNHLLYAREVLDSGYHVLISSIDMIYTQSPFHHLHPSADIQGSSIQSDSYDLSSRFLAIRSTNDGKTILNNIIQCQTSNIQYYQQQVALTSTARDTTNDIVHTVDYCINQVTAQQLQSSITASKHMLSPLLFPTAEQFFKQHTPQYAGVNPVVVYSTATTNALKEAQYREYNLWHGKNSDTLTCQPDPIPIEYNNELDNKPWILTIQIITGTQPGMLHQLLASIVAADYHMIHSQQTINLKIYIDEPNNNDKSTYLQIQSIVSSLQWSYGSIDTVYHKSHSGLFGHWPGNTVQNNELILYLDEYALVHKSYYTVIQQLITQYYLNQSQYDAQMIGISLAAQNIILGEPNLTSKMINGIYDAHTTDTLSLHKSTIFYRAQTINFNGQLLFPIHYQNYVAWLNNVKLQLQSRPITPCVPNLITNRLWLIEQSHNTTEHHHSEYEHIPLWIQWYIRYMYEKGYYTGVVNQQHNVVYDRDTSRYHDIIHANIAINDMYDTIHTMQWPELHNTPIFDYHMRLVRYSNTLQYRSSLAAVEHIDQCIMQNQYNHTTP